MLRNMGPAWDVLYHILLVKFAVQISYSVFVSVVPFGVLVLNHSDVLRDPAFRSKVAIAGVLPLISLLFHLRIVAWQMHSLLQGHNRGSFIAMYFCKRCLMLHASR